MDKRHINIKMLDNEFWWGAVVDYGAEMPYDEKTDCVIDLNIHGRDQRSPLFLSNKGRYIYSAKPFKIIIKKAVITIESEYEVELVEGFETLKGAHLAVANRYFQHDKEMPSETFFRVPQYNTWIELMYNQNQKQILAYAHSIVDNGMTPGILMIDEGWSEDYGVFDFYPGRFENPKAMIEELHQLGFSVMLWITPQISPDSGAFRELRNTDFLIKDKNDRFAIREWWNGYSCVLDLSNPKACEWLHGKLRGVIEKYGVDGFKFDAGDAYFYEDDDHTYVRQLALDNTKDYNMFASGYLYNELRAVWNMGGEPLVCRLQDKLHSWDKGIHHIIPNTIIQGLLGYYYGCPDMIGGGDYGSFIGTDFKLDEELYIRWLEASVLCPMMQFSIAPWRVLSADNYKIVKDYAKIRETYAPYIIKLAKEAARGGGPIIRAMEYEFPRCGYERVMDMFMLGDRYLVIPMLQKNGKTRNVKLPEGKWRDTNGRFYDGGMEITLEYQLSTLYVLEKMQG